MACHSLDMPWYACLPTMLGRDSCYDIPFFIPCCAHHRAMHSGHSWHGRVVYMTCTACYHTTETNSYMLRNIPTYHVMCSTWHVKSCSWHGKSQTWHVIFNTCHVRQIDIPCSFFYLVCYTFVPSMLVAFLLCTPYGVPNMLGFLSSMYAKHSTSFHPLHPHRVHLTWASRESAFPPPRPSTYRTEVQLMSHLLPSNLRHYRSFADLTELWSLSRTHRAKIIEACYPIQAAHSLQWNGHNSPPAASTQPTEHRTYQAMRCTW